MIRRQDRAVAIGGGRILPSCIRARGAPASRWTASRRPAGRSFSATQRSDVAHCVAACERLKAQLRAGLKDRPFAEPSDEQLAVQAEDVQWADARLQARIEAFGADAAYGVTADMKAVGRKASLPIAYESLRSFFVGAVRMPRFLLRQLQLVMRTCRFRSGIIRCVSGEASEACIAASAGMAASLPSSSTGRLAFDVELLADLCDHFAVAVVDRVLEPAQMFLAVCRGLA